MRSDVVIGLQHGDEAKGKVTHYLCKYKDYTHVLRFNGGCNAGHTIYHEGRKFVTHHIPAGVFYGVKSIIGPGCVVNATQFFKELQELKDGGINTEGKIFIAENTHVITNLHIEEEHSETKIGTTKRGNGPAYRDKYARLGVQAKNVPALKPYLIDLYEEFHAPGAITNVLCEGAQGFELDIDWGDYPYVTSSHCGVGGALLNGIPYNSVRDVWGVGKVYETYVGAKQFEPLEEQEFFARIREAGEEYGATTGRPRQCNYLNLTTLKKSIAVNAVNKLVLNKVDVLRTLNSWRLINNNETVSFSGEEEMLAYITKELPNVEIYFSDSKHRI
jgi:adenylosuccinate synthase